MYGLVIDLHVTKLPKIKTWQNYNPISESLELIKSPVADEEKIEKIKTDNGGGDIEEDKIKTDKPNKWIEGLNIVAIASAFAFLNRYYLQVVLKTPVEVLLENNSILIYDSICYSGFMLYKTILPPGDDLDLAYDRRIMPFWFLGTLFRQILFAHDLNNL